MRRAVPPKLRPIGAFICPIKLRSQIHCLLYNKYLSIASYGFENHVYIYTYISRKDGLALNPPALPESLTEIKAGCVHMAL